MKCERAWLLDLYPQRGEMILWFITAGGERLRLADPFRPVFYADCRSAEGPPGAARDRLLRAIEPMQGFEPRGAEQRLDFWTGRAREVERIDVVNMDHYTPDLRRLARRCPELAYYNCDILPEMLYGYERGIFPTALCEIEHEAGRLLDFRLDDDAEAARYEPPPLREAELQAEGDLGGRRPRLRSLTLSWEGRSITWDDGPPAAIMRSLRDALREADPDLIWTLGGDSVLMPALFAMAEQCRLPSLGLDREPGVERRLVYDGRTYVSYGRVLYQAPDYPLFGRWHIDRNNSFWTSEAGLAGLLEVARMSKLPAQRAARRSIGTGISSIQLDFAYRSGYLIPWKKSQPEAWKTATTLLKSDRGGLVYQPLVGVYEDVVELDFASMYPTIMVRCNVSPETVNCACCPPSRDVPEIGYTICREREGLVSRALEPIIRKRSELKALRAEHRAAAKGESDPERAEEHLALAERYDQRQGSLKWLLVCCFGYLGYRNARFGRIEAHESTCAFSREKLLLAREICEQRGFRVLHAIVDCVWLQRPGERASDAEIKELCGEIDRATNLKIAVEGRYRWIAFLPSRQDPEMPVPNRYFGCFETGELKFRGIEIRRSDQAPCAKLLQQSLLDRLRSARDLAEARTMKEELAELVREAEDRLRYLESPLDEVVLKRKTSREAEEYRNNSMTAVAARQAKRAGIALHAGEAVRFVVLDAKNRDPNSRLRLLPLLRAEETYDVAFYVDQVRRAAATVLEPLLGEPIEKILDLPKPEPKRRGKNAKSARAPEPSEPEPVTQPDLFEPAQAR